MITISLQGSWSGLITISLDHYLTIRRGLVRSDHYLTIRVLVRSDHYLNIRVVVRSDH